MSSRGGGRRNLYPIAVLLNGLTDEDVNCRINSMKRLAEIAEALGAERTRTELIPFMVDCLSDDEEEVLSEFAVQLGGFAPLVGGITYVAVLVKPLELLCKVEEASVRNRAVASITAILDQVKEDEVPDLAIQHFWPLTVRLAENRWYTARSSSCGIAPALYQLLSEDDRQTIRRLYWALCQDQTPMVRRYASKHLGKLASVIEPQFLVSAVAAQKNDCIFTYLDMLRKDEQDSVRLLTVETCIEMTRLLPSRKAVKLIVPLIKALGRDKSWRVRYMVAEQYASLCQAMGAEVTSTELITLFSNLCLDKEAEVRSVGATQIAGVCSLLSKDQVIAQFLPTIVRLVRDQSEHVRTALAGVIMAISSILGRDATIRHLLDHFLALLKDDHAEVRLNIISKLSDVNSVIGAELLSGSGLMPSICELAQDKQWRVRLSIINHIPLLAKQLGKTYFNEQLRRLCVVWLSDSVYTIREAATRNVIELTKIFGEEWAKEFIIPEALRLKTDTNYLHRMMVLFMVSGLAPIVSRECISEMLPTVLELANDAVPNIQFNVAKTLVSLLPKLDRPTMRGTVKPIIVTMSQSDDPDVCQHGRMALERVEEVERE